MIIPSSRPVLLSIDDASRVGEARRAATAMADRLGFDETGRGKVALVVTEVTTNLARHARGGQILIQGIEAGPIGGIDVLAVDRGPGIFDVERCMTDGFSTAGTPGRGLGAMSRLSTSFDLHSVPGTGTTLLSRLWSGDRAANGPEFGAVCLPMAGEEVCGDGWAIESSASSTLLLVVDGLGHGPQAAEAARAAVAVLGENPSLGPAELIQVAHAALRGTRGAALAAARMDRGRGELRYAGIGNISGMILGLAEGSSTSLVSHNGIVGHAIRKVQEFTQPWTPGSLLVMHSDGLATQRHLGPYAGLARRHPSLIAGTFYRDFARGRDDVTVVAVREGDASLR